MKLKRLMAVTMSMVMAFSMTAFANDADAVAVYEELAAKSNGMTDMDAYYDFNIGVDGAGMKVGARLEMNAKANNITTPELMRMNMYMRMTMTGLEVQASGTEPAQSLSAEELSGLTMTGNMYYEDGMYYIDMMGQKVKQPMPLEEILNDVKQTTGMMTTGVEYLQNLKLRTEGDNRILSFTMDAAKMNELLQQVMGMPGMESMAGSGAAVSYRDISGEYIIDAEGNCLKVKMNMTMDMTMGDQSMSITLDGDVGFANPGQPVEIQTPDLSGYTLAEAAA